MDVQKNFREKCFKENEQSADKNDALYSETGRRTEEGPSSVLVDLRVKTSVSCSFCFKSTELKAIPGARSQGVHVLSSTGFALTCAFSDLGSKPLITRNLAYFLSSMFAALYCIKSLISNSLIQKSSSMEYPCSPAVLVIAYSRFLWECFQ